MSPFKVVVFADPSGVDADPWNDHDQIEVASYYFAGYAEARKFFGRLIFALEAVPADERHTMSALFYQRETNWKDMSAETMASYNRVKKEQGL